MDSGSLSDTMTEVTGYDGSASTYQATGLTSGTQYRFAVTAVNSIGESDFSKEVRFAAAVALNQPAQLQLGTSSTRTQMVLEWQDEESLHSYATPITGYLVEVYSDSDSEWQVIWNGAQRPDILSYGFTSTAGNLYKFRHLAYNQNGASAYSNTLEAYSCENPANPNAPTWEESTVDSITIYWDAPSDNGGCPVTHYQVLRNSGNDDAVSTLVHSAEMLDLSSITGLVVTEFPSSSEGKDFKFIVSVYTAHGSSSSAESSAMRLAGVPDTPSQAPSRASSTSDT